MSDPAQVEVTNEAPIKVAITDAIGDVKPEQPASTSEVHQTVVTSQAPERVYWYGTPKFDDWLRFWFGTMIIGGFVFMVLYGQVTGKKPDKDTVLVYVSLVTFCLGFYYGSSYGSNNKSKTGLV